jgi:hypothetical protein
MEEPDCPPGCQTKLLPPVAMRVTEEPEQITLFVEVIVGEGIVLTVTLEVALSVQPFAAVTVTVYEDDEPGATTIELDVCPPGFQT